MSWPRRLLGLALLGGAYLPLHRLLDPERTGLAGAATRGAADAAWALGVWGTVLVVGVAATLAILAPVDPWTLLRRAGEPLRRPSSPAFALGCGAAAAALSALASLALFGGRPTSVDEMVQLLHARILLEGTATLPLPGDPAAWMVQNSWLTAGGWASVYPPFHTILLALGLAAGASWAVGPLVVGGGVAAFALGMETLLPQRRAQARASAVLVALSPFVLLLGGTHLSHTTAAAAAALLFWTAARARGGNPGWALAAGAATGALVATRPWTGVVVASAVLAALWLPYLARERWRWGAPRVAALLVGGLPFALLLLGWNRSLFDHPLRLGYSVAFGPAHGLGFHDDPWGNAYGVLEALAYTGADLVLLGGVLLESALPAVAVVGAGLLLAPAAWRGTGPLLAWALAGLAANAVYWHHGIHMGPRFLYETAPAWVVLWVVAARTLSAPGPSAGPLVVRRGWGWVALLSLAVGVVQAPGRATSHAGGEAARSALPTPPTTPALIFAHGSWATRVSARLTASGMRRDSVETALRRNDLCAVDAYARWRTGGGSPPPALDLEPRSGVAAGLTPVRLSEGNTVWLRPGATLPERCLREAQADRRGTVELEPLLWEAPPIPAAEVVVARDLGPAGNARVLQEFPGWTPLVMVTGDDGAPVLLPYDTGMELLWGGAAGAARATSGGG